MTGATSSDAYRICFGQALDDSECHVRVRQARTHEDVAVVLSRKHDGVDPWFLVGKFADNVRRSKNWIGADGAALDFDWTHPALQDGEGHLPVPEEIVERLLAAARHGMLPPGVLFMTRRGFRFVALFKKMVDDAETYKAAVKELGQLVLDALDDEQIPLSRSGTPGFGLDESCTRVAQVQRVPADDVEVIVTGNPIYDPDTLARGDVRLSLDVNAALPKDLARAVRQIARWIQIAPAIVVTHLLSAASALIGNTRVVTVRGLVHNVSLQFLNLLPSSAGKSTLRGYLAQAIRPMVADVLRRREQAARDHEEYDQKLAAGKDAKKNKKRGPRPEPPRSRRRETLILTEGTLEGVYKALVDSPRGIGWSTSEAHEITASLGRYSDGKKGRDLDTARLRKLTEGEDTELHRKGEPIMAIRSPFVTLDMDAQPAIRQTLFNEGDWGSGLVPRFLIHQPPSQGGLRKFVNPPPEPADDILDGITAKYEKLWAIRLKLDEDERPVPKAIKLDEEAEHLWAVEIERHDRLTPMVEPDEEAFLGHLRGRLLRLAAVLALWADPNAGFVDAASMRRAIVLGRYFIRHHREGSQEWKAKKHREEVEILKAWAKRRIAAGKDVSIREVQREHRRYRDPHARDLVIAHLREAGLTPSRCPKSGEGGRPKSDRWTFKNASTKPAKLPRGEKGCTGSAAKVSYNGAKVDWSARFEQLNQELEREVDLPEAGGACPICGHRDCFGRVPGTSRWKCHSANHASDSGGSADNGDLVDLVLYSRNGSIPTKQERLRLWQERYLRNTTTNQTVSVKAAPEAGAAPPGAPPPRCVPERQADNDGGADDDDKSNDTKQSEEHRPSPPRERIVFNDSPDSARKPAAPIEKRIHARSPKPECGATKDGDRISANVASKDSGKRNAQNQETRS